MDEGIGTYKQMMKGVTHNKYTTKKEVKKINSLTIVETAILALEIIEANGKHNKEIDRLAMEIVQKMTDEENK